MKKSKSELALEAFLSALAFLEGHKFVRRLLAFSLSLTTILHFSTNEIVIIINAIK